VSDHAAARLGVRHETPQAILLRDGRPVWNASHFRITADALGKIVTW
jgi:bacillithiol system protein YtxJ